jgi:Ca-activated chloride channel family protein
MGRFHYQSTLLIASTALLAAQPTFKVDVPLVRLLVSVKDAKGQLVGSLNKPDFTVYDCGVKQEVAVFEHNTTLPLSVSLLIDISGSTAKDLPYEVTSINKFLKALLTEGNTDDAASLYSFNDQVTLLSSFTRRQQRLTDALGQLKASAGTSMYDALSLASQGLRNRDGRHVMVVVTDGGDTTSARKYRDAVEAVQRSEAVVYPILVVPITNDAGRNVGGENALTQMSGDTGGRVFSPSLGAQMDAAFADILRDLRTQYLVAYYPRNLPAEAPRFRPVRVELSRKDLQASTRSGYYGDSAPPR